MKCSPVNLQAASSDGLSMVCPWANGHCFGENLEEIGENPWRKMMIHQQKQRDFSVMWLAGQNGPISSSTKTDNDQRLTKPDQTRPLKKKPRPERWDTSARLRGSTHPHLSRWRNFTVVNGPRHPRRHRRVIDVESMSNICGEFCETRSSWEVLRVPVFES